MRLLAAAVCDHASATPDGKLDVHGIFHDLYAPGFPARQDRMTLVLVLEWGRNDSGRFSFRVDVRGPGGKPTLTVEGQSEVSPRPADRPPPRTRVILPLEDVVFPSPGKYEFRVTARGRTLPGPVLYLTGTEASGVTSGVARESP